jgi:hypothetical protein
MRQSKQSRQRQSNKFIIAIIVCLEFISDGNAESFSSIDSMNLLIDVSHQITNKIDNYLIDHNLHNQETIQ